ncbi:hypothetical protein [Halobaculum magnesiiphilum]|uniref:Uncharacterized protein n=1 Tax=Halobaculum magnesiiphilum TaxID=1017351 RepID=A0A8T8WCA7_9EURY|nr:hypothetical protein [Halobaculum magnesiiphilum]QZP37497.1 hypothetical protein K6T50_14665 [Halobaculum magnesiiphilum]
MKFKLVPEAPEALGFVADAQAAVPLVPGSEDDCCARLMRRLGLRSRDVARTWLTFLRALDLAEETEDGFKRLRADPTPAYLREQFLTGVYGAGDVADALLAADAEGKSDPDRESDPDEANGLAADEAFAVFVDRVPNWERYRTDDWESVWRERVERHLAWFVLLDLAERRGDAYAATDRLRELRERADNDG